MAFFDAYLPLLGFASLFRDDVTLHSLPYETVRGDIEKLLQSASSRCASLRAYYPALADDALFAACAFADEVLLLTAWEGRNEWTRNTLQFTYCHEHNAGVVFYEKLGALMQRNAVASFAASRNAYSPTFPPEVTPSRSSGYMPESAAFGDSWGSVHFSEPRPMRPAHPAGSASPANAMHPASPVNSVYPVNPASSAYPTNSAYPAPPTSPVNPMNPAYLANQANQSYPVDPMNPAYPVSPMNQAHAAPGQIPPPSYLASASSFAGAEGFLPSPHEYASSHTGAAGAGSGFPDAAQPSRLGSQRKFVGVLDYVKERELEEERAAGGAKGTLANLLPIFRQKRTPATGDTFAFQPVEQPTRETIQPLRAATPDSLKEAQEGHGTMSEQGAREEVIALFAAALSLGFRGQYHSEEAREALYATTVASLQSSVAGRVAMTETLITPEAYYMPPVAERAATFSIAKTGLLYLAPALASLLIYQIYNAVISAHAADWLQHLQF